MPISQEVDIKLLTMSSYSSFYFETLHYFRKKANEADASFSFIVLTIFVFFKSLWTCSLSKIPACKFLIVKS